MANPRRPNQFVQDKVVADASTVAAIAATSTIILQTMDGDYVVDKFEVMMPGGYTADDTNYYTLTLQKGATVLATLSLKTVGGGGFGNLTDLVPAAATLAANPTGSKDDVLKVVLTKTSAAANVPAGTRLIAHCRQL